RVQLRGGEHDLDPPGVPVREAAPRGVLAEHVPGLDFKDFADPVTHGGRRPEGQISRGLDGSRMSAIVRRCRLDLVVWISGDLARLPRSGYVPRVLPKSSTWRRWQ